MGQKVDESLNKLPDESFPGRLLMQLALGTIVCAIYLLVHAYGQRAVMASGVAAELRPRLEPFCAELF